MMFTDLDNRTAKYSGFPVDWGSWDNYMDDVVCRCAQVSKAKGFKYFGVENFGEYKCYHRRTGKQYKRMLINFCWVMFLVCCKCQYEVVGNYFSGAGCQPTARPPNAT